MFEFGDETTPDPSYQNCTEQDGGDSTSEHHIKSCTWQIFRNHVSWTWVGRNLRKDSTSEHLTCTVNVERTNTHWQSNSEARRYCATFLYQARSTKLCHILGTHQQTQYPLLSAIHLHLVAVVWADITMQRTESSIPVKDGMNSGRLVCCVQGDLIIDFSCILVVLIDGAIQWPLFEDGIASSTYCQQL